MNIDNIVIEEIPAIDVAAVSGTIPDISPFLTNSEPITISITNTGLSQVSDIPVNFELVDPMGNTSTVSEIFNTTLQPGQSDNYAFESGADFDMVGNYQVTLFTSLDTDGSSFNNTSDIFETGKIDVYKGSLPFFEDFEGTNEYAGGRSIAQIENLQSATFLTNDLDGEFQFSFDSRFESNSVKIQSRTNNKKSDLIFTLDLSDFEVERDEILLSLKYQFFSFQTLPNNQIFIRGNASDPWLPLFTWDNVDFNSFDDLSLNNLSEVLLSNSQQYGEAFQVKFGNEGLNQLAIDDVMISLISSSPNIVNPIEDQNLTEGFGTLLIDLTNTFNDIDGDNLTLSSSSSNAEIVTAGISENILTITELEIGTTDVAVTADDGNQGTVTDTFTITVSPNDVIPNSAPLISNIEDQSIPINGLITIDLILSDPEGDPLTVTATSDNQSVINEAGLIISGEDNDRTLTLNPIPDQTGLANITVQVSDGELSASTSFAIEANPITGISEPNVNEPVTIFPNPTNGILRLQSPSFIEVEAFDVKLFDLAGNLDILEAVQINASSYAIDLTGKIPGIYFIQITLDDVQFLKRIIKN